MSETWTAPEVYSARGDTVFKEPVTTRHPEGGETITVGFPVCRVTEYVSDQAETVAVLMNRGTVAGDLYEAGAKVMAGLLARIDAAPSTAKPVFDGIAELHDALNRARGES